MQENRGKPGNGNRQPGNVNWETRTWIIHLLKQNLLSFEHHRTLAFRYIT